MLVPTFAAKSYDFCAYVDARNVIGGELVPPSGETVLPIVNARNGKTIASVRLSTKADVAKAVQAGKAAFAEWRWKPIRERAQVLYKARELLLRDIDELSWLVSHENGKIYSEARAEVEKGIECLEYGCSLPNIASGNQLEVSRGVSCEILYEPLGVVASIVPFNFPLMVPFWTIPQALVAGNALILKASERVPLSAMRVAGLFLEAGLPKGVFNVVQGGKEAVEALCDHPDVKAVSFVGSTPVARQVYARASAAGKRALCLGGAKNHLILVPDADVKVAADNIVASFTGCAGQRCMAAAVLVAVGEVDPIIAAIRERAEKLVLGKDVGPVTSPAAVAKMTRYVTEAEQAGAKVLVDGRGKSGGEGGSWFGPTIVDGVTPTMPAACDEIFGPVLTIVRTQTLDEALKIENGSPFGNAAAVYTTSGDVAKRVMDSVEAGMCGVNVGVPVPREPFGFGGWNDSCFGHGNLTGWDGYRFFTRQRKVTKKWELQKDQTWMS